jgi:hypothetical protein
LSWGHYSGRQPLPTDDSIGDSFCVGRRGTNEFSARARQSWRENVVVGTSIVDHDGNDSELIDEGERGELLGDGDPGEPIIVI